MVDGGAISGPPRDLLASDDNRVAEFLKADSDPCYERRELEVTNPLVDREKA
jgi:hypothetical protein